MYKVFMLLRICISQHRAAQVQYPETYLQTLQIICLSGAVVRSNLPKPKGFKRILEAKSEAHIITDCIGLNKKFPKLCY